MTDALNGDFRIGRLGGIALVFFRKIEAHFLFKLSLLDLLDLGRDRDCHLDLLSVLILPRDVLEELPKHGALLVLGPVSGHEVDDPKQRPVTLRPSLLNGGDHHGASGAGPVFQRIPPSLKSLILLNDGVGRLLIPVVV